MRKNLSTLFFIFVFFVLGFPLKVFAVETSPTIINARILPTIWYSSLSVKEGESIKIYAGIQNNSSVNFTGTATFYLDDKELSHITFSSKTNTLEDVFTNWIAKSGGHEVQVKILTSLPADKILVSYESDKININVTPKVIVPIADVVEEKVLDTASLAVSKADDFADVLADKIDSYKKPVSTSSARQGLAESSVNKKTSSILGVSVGPAISSVIQNIKNYSPLDLAYNFFLTIVSFLVKNWKWSLGGVVFLFLYLKFFK